MDAFPDPGAVYTDGSLGSSGGAAVWEPDTETAVRCSVPGATSSTQCELAALCMAMALVPPQVLTDSLCSLQLLRGWRNTMVPRVLQCDLRMLVRQVLAAAQRCPSPPKLEKVAAHDEKLIRLGHPKAMGNEQADFWAKKVALEPGCEAWLPAPGLHGDVVELVDSAGKVVWSVSESFPLA